MRIPVSCGSVVSVAAAITLLSGCSSGGSMAYPMDGGANSFSRSIANKDNGKSSIVSPILAVPKGSSRTTKTWMTPYTAGRLAYMSDYGANNVTVFAQKTGVVRGQIGGLSRPQGIFVDSNNNLWVANYGGGNVLEFARGGTSPINTLTDPAGAPVDVTICPNGTVYVSDFNGVIQVYASGSTSPTGSLTAPSETGALFVTCDKHGNVFATVTINGGGAVVAYAGGSQSSYFQLPVYPYYPGGIKPDNSGNLLIVDQFHQTITEYTEAGVPTGQKIVAGTAPNATDIIDIGVQRNSAVVGGADANNAHGITWSWPGAVQQRLYSAPGASVPDGFAFDPAQKGLGN